MMRYLTPIGRMAALALLAICCGAATGWVLAEAVAHDTAARPYQRPTWACDPEAGR